MTNGPCGWTPTHLHHSAADLAEWLAYTPAIRALADLVASRVLWSSTGRQFGACATIARPVLCPHYVSEAWVGGSAPWVPVDLGSGDWINWPSFSSCSRIDPARTKLLGPVNAITSITIGGVLLVPAKYRVDDGEFIVRVDGLSWPLWQDVNLPGTDASAFVVNYTMGIPVPAELLAAAGTYALEYARALDPSGSTACRLPSRAKTITRQGVTIDMVDPTVLLERGLTGLPDVDALIVAFNPHGQIHMPRVLVPSGHAPMVSA